MNPTADFTLADFQRQLRQLRKLQSMGQFLRKIPGLGKLMERLENVDPDHDMTRIDAMICSMTPWEREHPDRIDPDRQVRIASGSGTAVSELAGFLSDFAAMSRLMAEMAKLGFAERQRAMKNARWLRLSGPSLN